MPDLLEREKREGELYDALRRIAPEHRQRIEQLLGYPPDPAKLTPEVIRQLEKEMQHDDMRAALALVFLLAMQGMNSGFSRETGVEVSPEQAGRDAAQYAERRAAELAEDFTRHTVETLRQGAQKVQELIVDGRDEAALGRWQSSLDASFGEARSERASITETTGAVSAGEDNYRRHVERTTRFTLIGIWRHKPGRRPPRHANAPVDPCPICSPLENLPQNQWPPEVAHGPPAHGHCDCFVEYVVLTQDEASQLRIGAGPDIPELSGRNVPRFA